MVHKTIWTTVLTPEKAMLALVSGINLVWSSQIPPILSSIKSGASLTVPTGYTLGPPRVRGGELQNFNRWDTMAPEEIATVILSGLMGSYLDGLYLVEYVFESFTSSGPYLAASRHTTLEDRFQLELLQRTFRQTKKRKAGIFRGRIHGVKPPLVDHRTIRIPIKESAEDFAQDIK